MYPCTCFVVLSVAPFNVRQSINPLELRTLWPWTMDVKQEDATMQAEAQDERSQQQQQEEIKVIVMNYGKWKAPKALSDVLHAKGVQFFKVQKSRQLSFGFVHFRSAEARRGHAKMQAIDWNGEPLEVKDALPKKSMKPMRTRGKARPRQEGQGGQGRGEAAGGGRI